MPLQTNFLPDDDETTPATKTGPTSVRGRRLAYQDVAKSQWERFSTCNITFFSLLTTYSIVKSTNKIVKSTLTEPMTLLTLSDHGKTTYNLRY